MKTKLHYIFVLFSVCVIAMIYINIEKDSEIKTISEQREIHEIFLKNSPFKKTLELSKSERKTQGLPPNKYYEREWELTMNPKTGKPEPYKVLEFQKKRNSIKKRVPGDGTSGNNWIDRGPNNVGGRTRVVLFDPNDSTNKRVFAGGVSGGLWVNNDITDANSSWSLVSSVPGNMNISCITVDPNDFNTWYIGTGEQYTFGAAVGNGVYKTTDGGNNWVNVPIQLAGGGTSGNNFAGIYYINDIVAWNNNGSTEVFIGVGTHVYGDAANPTNWLGFQNAGLYKSTDGGLNWNRNESSNLESSFGSNYFYIPNDFEISANNTLWFGSIATPGTGGTGGGLVFSSTDGNIWIEAVASPLADSNRVELAVSSTNANKMYALTEGTTNTGPHIYATNDAFATVSERAKPDDADSGIPTNDFTRGQDFYNLVIEVDPNNDEIVYVGGIDLFRCTNGSTISLNTDWKQISKWSNNNNLNNLTCSYVHADQHAFTFRPGNSNEAVIGCDGGVFYATSLSTAETIDVFDARNTEYNVTQFYYSGYGQSTTNELIISGAQDNGSQFFNGANSGTNSTFDVFGGDGAFSVIDEDGDYMIVSYVYNEHVYFNLPYDGSGYYIDSWSSQADTEGDFINPGGLDHNLNILYTNGTDGTFQINRYELGSNSATKTQLTDNLLDGSPTAFKVSPFTPGSTTLMVGTDNGKLLKLTNADDAILGNIVWEEITGASFLGSVSAIEFGATENDLLVTFHNYGVTNIWSSNDGGATWNSKEGNLPDMPVKCILQNPLIPTEVIVGTELGVWSTSDFDNVSPTWESSYNGMRDVKVVDLDLRTADNSVLATTFGRGVFTGQFTNPEFILTTSNETVSVCKPNNAVFNMELIADAGYNTTTTFSTNGVPTGASVSFSPTSLNSSGLFTMTISNLAGVSPGDYTIEVIGTGNETNSIEVTLEVFDPTINSINLSNPANEEVGVSESGTTFSWASDVNVTSYDFDIATDAGFNSLIESSNINTNSYTLTSTLTTGTVYYWRVRGKNDCDIGNFTIQNFQTNISSGVNCLEFSNNNSVTIPDALDDNNPDTPGEVSSSITFPNDISISDVNITVDIEHYNVRHLIISLTSPSGPEIILFSQKCNSSVDDIDAIFDDDGNIHNCTPPILTGNIIPENALSGFNNQSSSGDWIIKVSDNIFNQNGNTGTLNSWSLEICGNQTVAVLNSTLTNNLITVATNSSYIFNQSQTDIEASSSGSTAAEQQFMLTQLPSEGTIRLNNTILSLGESFSQDDIDLGKVSYVNTSSVTSSDSFTIDITNATSGFLPNQIVNINIDAALSIGESFLSESGINIYPTITNDRLYISSQNNLGKTVIELYAINGQLVLQTELNFYRGNVEQLSIGQYSSGIYILKLSSEELSGSKKIILK